MNVSLKVANAGLAAAKESRRYRYAVGRGRRLLRTLMLVAVKLFNHLAEVASQADLFHNKLHDN